MGGQFYSGPICCCGAKEPNRDGPPLRFEDLQKPSGAQDAKSSGNQDGIKQIQSQFQTSDAQPRENQFIDVPGLQRPPASNTTSMPVVPAAASSASAPSIPTSSTQPCTQKVTEEYVRSALEEVRKEEQVKKQQEAAAQTS